MRGGGGGRARRRRRRLALALFLLFLRRHAHAVGRQLGSTYDHGDVVDDDLKADPGFLRHPAGMAEQSEAGDIGGP